jgi:hypothetical protein
MKNERHNLIAAQLCRQSEVLFSQNEQLEWTIFRTGENSLLVVCTPKNEDTRFIPVLKFYYRLISKETFPVKKYSFVSETKMLERAIAVFGTVSEGFVGRINVFAAIDDYPAIQTEVEWQ